MENNASANQTDYEKKSIFQKISDIPSWIWGLTSIMLFFIFPALFGSLFSDLFNGLRGNYSSFFGFLIYLLPTFGIAKGIIEIRSSEIKSGIAGIIISLIASGLLIFFYVA